MADSYDIWDDDGVIVFFRGVFPDRYDFDILMTNQVMAELMASEPSGDAHDDTIIETYDRIPSRFTTEAEWPRTINARCLQCIRQFKTRPLTMVTHINNDGVTISDMTTFGVMCSAECVATYINTRVHDERTRWARQKMLTIFYLKLTGTRVDSFPMTNTPEALEIFGIGTVTMADHIKSLKYTVPVPRAIVAPPVSTREPEPVTG